MNYIKVLVAFTCFVVASYAFDLIIPLSGQSIWYLCLSGAVGLWLGDIFLFKAFAHLGSGRVLMLFGFQPLILGASAFYLFDQEFPLARLFAVLLLMGCLFTFSLESFRQKGHWDLAGLGFALLGVGLDAAGLLLTKASFEMHPELSPFYANVFRCGVAVTGFFILSWIPWARFSLFEPMKKIIQPKEILLISAASFMGTFMSLSLYFMAVKNGHLATISAVAGTSPLFATFLETLIGRKKVSVYLLVGTAFFIAGLVTLAVT